MQLVTNLDDANDIRASVEFLIKCLAPEASLTESFVDDVWSRVGQSVRGMLKTAAKAAEKAEWITIDKLAGDLGREYKSVRSSLNGPLARAIKSAKQALPGAPDLLEWRFNGTVHEFRISPEIRAALAKHEHTFDEIPPAE